MIEMNEYEKLIENLAKNRESMMFYNSGPEHAAIVFSNIFKYSGKELCIYAGDMNGNISNTANYLKELKGFLDRKGKLKLLLQHFDQKNNEQLFSLLKRYQFFNPDQVIIKTSTQRLKNSDTGREAHICIADKVAYRIEDDTEKYSARGSFNDPGICDALFKTFIGMFEAGKAVTLN